MTTYEAIFRRAAIRDYKEQKLSKWAKEEITRIISELKPLVANTGVKFQIMEMEDFEKYFRGTHVKAPYYAIITSRETDKYLENVGFMGQQFVLNLTVMGLGTCWLGNVKPSKKAGIENKYCITIAFGYPADSHAFRNDKSEFKRLPIDKVILGAQPYGDDIGLIEAARLAPSGMNLQPLRYAAGDNVIHVYRRESFRSKSKAVENMQNIDIGIALAHLDIAMAQRNHNAVFRNKRTHTIDKMKYIISVS